MPGRNKAEQCVGSTVFPSHCIPLYKHQKGNQPSQLTDLLRNVRPIPWRPQRLQLPLKRLPHLDDPPRHCLNVLLPLVKQSSLLLVVEYKRNNTGSPGGWRRDLGSLEDGELGFDFIVRRRRGGDKVECANSFGVETGVLGGWQKTMAERKGSRIGERSA
jgi:hypothetical protein